MNPAAPANQVGPHLRASWLFYLLIDEAGAATAGVITYVMPVVALVLGVAVLGESFTVGAIVGLVLIAAGAWLATGGQARRRAIRPGLRASQLACWNGGSGPPTDWKAPPRVVAGHRP